MIENEVCAAQLEAAIVVMLGFLPDQINQTVTPVEQMERDLRFGGYERMPAENPGTACI